MKNKKELYIQKYNIYIVLLKKFYFILIKNFFFQK